jgi:predicted RNase H-like HicB family nuclease
VPDRSGVRLMKKIAIAGLEEAYLPTYISDTIQAMGFDDYKVVLYRNQPDGWVAEIPAIPGCHALMPTRDEALVELAAIFRLISDEYADRKEPLPADTTEIVHA